jgi:hypothetical protein
MTCDHLIVDPTHSATQAPIGCPAESSRSSVSFLRARDTAHGMEWIEQFGLYPPHSEQIVVLARQLRAAGETQDDAAALAAIARFVTADS